MKDFAKVLFKVVAVFQVLASLFYLFVFGASLIALIAGVNANDLIAASGNEQVELPMVAFVGILIVSLLVSVFYGLSAFGFFAMKKWQPIVFTILIGLSFVEMIINAVTVGFDLRLIFSLFASVVYVGLLVLVWMNKDLFGKKSA